MRRVWRRSGRAAKVAVFRVGRATCQIEGKTADALLLMRDRIRAQRTPLPVRLQRGLWCP